MVLMIKDSTGILVESFTLMSLCQAGSGERLPKDLFSLSPEKRFQRKWSKGMPEGLLPLTAAFRYLRKLPPEAVVFSCHSGIK